MSTLIMSACWPLQGMSPAQKAVLVSLADQANDEGVCWPSIASIGMRTCLSERAVQGALRWLVEAGALRVTERTGRSTVYRVTPAAYAPPQEMHPRISRTPAANAPPQEMHPRISRTPAANAPTPADAAPPPPQQMHPTPADAAPRTVKEPSVEPSGNRKTRGKRAPGFDAAAIELPDWLDHEDWQRWVQHRREIRKPITEQAAAAQLRELDKLRAAGHRPSAVIDHSVANGWQGLFPPRAATAPQAGTAADRRRAWGERLQEEIARHTGQPAATHTTTDLGVFDAAGNPVHHAA